MASYLPKTGRAGGALMAGRLTAHVGRLGTGKSYTAASEVLKGCRGGRKQVTSFDPRSLVSIGPMFMAKGCGRFG